MGGMVLETNMTEIITRIDDQNKLEKQEVSVECVALMTKVSMLNCSHSRSIIVIKWSIMAQCLTTQVINGSGSLALLEYQHENNS